ncbi:uncharacterized protein A1O5_10781 [Cladophialophora psammophila CBS 110553]|uniref:Uncharacterized protein n=1 Tax=Cladophialophora psammophila CBS 110553 TaxID=1182543 RepID=W9WMD2_9EURO|nr:uncharacterized protein A1O5_10781 [Cladophialophora psammophila CBS 110553]EXJ66165.1 hypothetical protein A1O5_10781 [Cladophialophora psammophila CBS 110553]
MVPTQTSFDAKPGQIVEVAQAKNVEDWQSLLAHHPRVFLHVIFSLEMAIQRGHFPKVTDLPLAICQQRSVSISSPPPSRLSSPPVNLGLTIPRSHGIPEVFTTDESTGALTPPDRSYVSDTNQTPVLPDLLMNVDLDFVDLEGFDAMDFDKTLDPASQLGWPSGMNSGLEEPFFLA